MPIKVASARPARDGAILDPSAALGIVMQDPGWEESGKAAGNAEWILAPDLLVAEAANACWKYAHRGILAQGECERILDQALALPDEFVPMLDLRREAFALAAAGRRPAYDMFYVVLARRNNATLLTFDKGLAEFAAAQGVNVAGAAK
jgi:predicted nucleic acid-binding protein